MSDQDFDERHSPATCNYRECRADAETKCPFVKDEPLPAAIQPDELDDELAAGITRKVPDCIHEFRNLHGYEFYCVHCLKVVEARP